MNRKVKPCGLFFLTVSCWLALQLSIPVFPDARQARGVVFVDNNHNGVMDPGEHGLAGVPVSNRRDVVLTDSKGEFRIPVENESILFVVKPAGYAVPLNALNHPQFFYIHHPKGSPADLEYPGIAPSGPLPKRIFFPLTKTDESDSFTAFIMGDPQTKTPEEIDFFREQIVSAMLPLPKPSFYLDLGDVVYDDLSQYDRFNRVTSVLGIPIRHTRGNHDTNYRALSDRAQTDTFKRWFGPDYYSFNVGKVHFMVLNTVRYHGYDVKNQKKGGYTGFVDERQLAWIKNDLAVTPEDCLVVITMHIPVTVSWDKSSRTEIINRAELLDLFKSRTRLLALAGHMHYFDYRLLDAETDWRGGAPFPQIIAGSGCGAWWHGPRDPRGIPLGLGVDGGANGFFVFQFSGNEYRYRFHPSAAFRGEIARINSPFGRIGAARAAGLKINVNVFAGTPDTRVEYSLDEAPSMPLTRTVMKDPFFEQLLRDHPNDYYDWVEAAENSHIWETTLPKPPAPGIHRLKITVTDSFGHSENLFQVFEVDPLP